MPSRLASRIHRSVALLSVFAIGLVGVRSAPAAVRNDEPVPQYDARTFHETTAITGASFSPDESKILYSSDASGVFNAYAISVDGGEPEQLTDSTTDSVFAVS